MFDGVLARGRVPEAVSDAAWLRAMLAENYTGMPYE